MRIFGPYYYGKHKWDDYLLDIQDSIKYSKVGQQQVGERREETLGIAHEQLDQMREQTQELRGIRAALNSGFEELRAEFEWGFTLLVDRMDIMIGHLSQISERLDADSEDLAVTAAESSGGAFPIGPGVLSKGTVGQSPRSVSQS